MPLLPIHLLWINLITDALPAFAIGLEPAEDDIMDRKPREKDEGFFANGLMVKVIWQGVMVGLLTLVSYSIGQYFSNHEYAMTMAFITMSGAELCHAFNVKSHHSVFNKQVFNNKYLWGATALGLVLQLAIIFTPLSHLFSLVPLDPSHCDCSITCILSYPNRKNL